MDSSVCLWSTSLVPTTATSILIFSSNLVLNSTSKYYNFLILAYAKINLSLDYILILFHNACSMSQKKHVKVLLLNCMISFLFNEWGKYCFWNKQYIQYVSLFFFLNKICCEKWEVFLSFMFWCFFTLFEFEVCIQMA